MDWKDAHAIIRQHQLIRGKISKQILYAIRNNLPITPEELPANASMHDIEQLRDHYKRKLAEMGTNPEKKHLKNQVFYKLIEDRAPNFSWEVRDKNVVFHAPKVNGLEQSLLSLLINKLGDEDKPFLYRKYAFLTDYDKNLIEELDRLFIKLKVVYPDEANMRAIMQWLTLGLQGEELHLFSLACPDYSAIPTGDLNCPFRHTFNELGSGIGLIARRIMEALPVIKESLDKFNIKFIPILAMADYEVLSESNLKRLNLSFAEFARRLEASRQAIKEQSKVLTQTPMITELCGGYEEWKKLYQYYCDKFSRKNFGQVGLNQKKLIEIVKARKSLYDRWYGSKDKLEDYIPLLLDQGTEYAAVGAIIYKHCENCLIVGADHSVLGLFYGVGNFIPSLYLKRFYC